MMQAYVNPDLKMMLLESQVSLLRQRIEEISLATRARLAEAASDLREEADCEAFGCDSGLAKAARRLESLAHGDLPCAF